MCSPLNKKDRAKSLKKFGGNAGQYNRLKRWGYKQVVQKVLKGDAKSVKSIGYNKLGKIKLNKYRGYKIIGSQGERITN